MKYDVYDIREMPEVTLALSLNKPVTQPWVIFMTDDDGNMSPVHRDLASVCGYADKEQAEQSVAALRLLPDTATVYLVLSNNDSYANMPVAVYRNAEAAEAFIMKQKGEWGTPMYRYIRWGVNVNGDTYASVYFNGYMLRAMELRA